jgi:putative CocE/NonD family hydrolase
MLQTRSKLLLTLVALALSLATLGGLAPASADIAAPPADFIAAKDTLSQPVFPQTIRESFRVPMKDGETLYVEIVRPDPAAYGDLKFPVIMEASPYHGPNGDRDGTRIFPDPVNENGAKIGLTGYFPPRGYAVAMVDLRGTGRSTGCLDHLGPNDASDLKTIIEWAADQPWSTGKVGMTGHSYVGSTPKVAAAQNPRGLATIIPSAGLASMYDHQFQKGVPYNLQWVGPMVAYEGLAIARDLPPQVPAIPVVGGSNGNGDNWTGTPNPQTGCGMQHSAALAGTGQVTGQYELWHAQRDWRNGALESDIPVFMIHGVNDNAARIPAAEWFFGRRFDREQDKVWIGQWDHGSTNGRCGDTSGARTLHPTCRFEQFQYAVHAWFDKHLKGMDVDTGPAVEAFLNARDAVNVTTIIDPESVDTKVYTDDAWSRPTRQSFYLDATDNSLKFGEPATAGSAAFQGSANAVAANAGGGVLRFTSEPLTEDTVFLGLPKLTLNASVSNQVSHLTVTLLREDEAGQREHMNTCAIQPQLRFGETTIAPVVPGQEMALPMTCFTMAHWVPAGDKIIAEVGTKTAHHASFGTDPRITVFTGPGRSIYQLPVASEAPLYDDVALRQAR